MEGREGEGGREGGEGGMEGEGYTYNHGSVKAVMGEH